MPTLDIDYNDLLFLKMQHELIVLIDDLKEMTTTEALEHSYEKTIKQELMYLCEEHELPQNKAKALYEKDNSLDAVYQEWLNTDSGIHQILTNILSETATKEFESIQNSTPVMPNEVVSTTGFIQTQ